MDHNHCLLQSKFFQEVLSHLYDTIYPFEGFLNGDLEFCPLAALLETFIAMKNLQTEIMHYYFGKTENTELRW